MDPVKSNHALRLSHAGATIASGLAALSLLLASTELLSWAVLPSADSDKVVLRHAYYRNQPWTEE